LYKRRLTEQLTTAVSERQYEALVFDGNHEPPCGLPGFDNAYELVESNLSKKIFRPVTGLDTAPTYLFVRRVIPLSDLSPGATGPPGE